MSESYPEYTVMKNDVSVSYTDSLPMAIKVAKTVMADFVKNADDKIVWKNSEAE